MLVRVIPTGVMELLGMAEALARLFPDHRFECVPAERPCKPFPGFTSVRLREAGIAPPAGLSKGRPVDGLVRQMVAELRPNRAQRRDRADMVIVIDDLELENADQPDVVVDYMRQAVQQHVRRLHQEEGDMYAERAAMALRERASFHLAVPMTESWFFTDSQVLLSAGVPDERLPARLVPDMDVEQFQSDDPDYLADDGSQCTGLKRHRRRKKPVPRAPWLVTRRTEHPKAYLSWLCREPGHKKCTTYRESVGGAEALRQLTWRSLLTHGQRSRYVRAMLRDIAARLDEEPLRFDQPEFFEAPLTSLSSLPSNPVLRNI